MQASYDRYILHTSIDIFSIYVYADTRIVYSFNLYSIVIVWYGMVWFVYVVCVYVYVYVYVLQLFIHNFIKVSLVLQLTYSMYAYHIHPINIEHHLTLYSNV